MSYKFTARDRKERKKVIEKQPKSKFLPLTDFFIFLCVLCVLCGEFSSY